MPRVLVVDDEEPTRTTYGAALGLHGYEVGLADSCATAIQRLSGTSAPDVLLLDLKLTDGTGLDLLRWMRERQCFVATAALTAFRFEFDPDEVIALGALAYADKPLSVDSVALLAASLAAPPQRSDDPDRLHLRVLAGDPGALECLDGILLAELPRRLIRAFPRTSTDLVEDAVSAACIEYGAGPHRLASLSGRSVVDFVSTIAWRNLRDRVRSEASRTKRERRWAAQRTSVVKPDFELLESRFNIWAILLSVIRPPKERRAVELWLDGSDNYEIARALQTGDLDVPTARRIAKQFKDRIIKRLSRYVRSAHNG